MKWEMELNNQKLGTDNDGPPKVVLRGLRPELWMDFQKDGSARDKNVMSRMHAWDSRPQVVCYSLPTASQA